MKEVLQYLSGGDLRSIGKSNLLAKQIKTQNDFDAVFEFLTHHDRLVVMRSADTLEKVSKLKPEWLTQHKGSLLRLLKKAVDKELKWHLALMCSRLTLNSPEVKSVWDVLSRWVLDGTESKIVRVNALQGLTDLATVHKQLKPHWARVVSKIKEENIPSLEARLRKLGS